MIRRKNFAPGIRISKLGATVDALRLSHCGRRPAIVRHTEMAAIVLITTLITSEVRNGRVASRDRGDVINGRLVVVTANFARVSGTRDSAL